MSSQVKGKLSDHEYTVSVLADERNRVLREIWRQNGVIERIEGPALTRYDPETGNVEAEFWHHNNELSRLDGGPAVIHYDPTSGNVTSEEYWVAGKLHREGDEPASILYGRKSRKIKKVEYYVNGLAHRDDGPAIIKYAASTGVVLEEIHMRHGQIHRDVGDAWIKRHWKNATVTFSAKYIAGHEVPCPNTQP